MRDEHHDGCPVLEREDALPQVPRHPAPWQLTASAYVLAVRMPEEILDRQSFVPPSLAGKRCGDISFFLYVDYSATNCGPYREIIFAPALYDFGEGRYPTITRIYVETYDSVVNGRLNWGIPKDRADFQHEREGKVDRVRVSRDGHVFADMRFAPYSLPMPVTSWLLPAGLRTLMQHWQGKSYRFTLSAKGMLRLGKLVDWHFDPKFFPDLARGKVIAGAYFPKFEMTFPVATVQDGLV
ncbi:MAG TPA: acetoacetate decarboxylase family protein [Polyangiales bacterium]|nr:acetoacetate decarboxylase family protein [Polyangiales bacterium]